MDAGRLGCKAARYAALISPLRGMVKYFSDSKETEDNSKSGNKPGTQHKENSRQQEQIMMQNKSDNKQ